MDLGAVMKIVSVTFVNRERDMETGSLPGEVKSEEQHYYI